MYDELIKRLRECTAEQNGEKTLWHQAADAIADLITALTASNEVIAKSKPKWIPVTERLPEYGEKCLVVFKLHSHNYYYIGVSYCYVQKEGFWSDCGRDYKATHWMPLPQPPESEGE